MRGNSGGGERGWRSALARHGLLGSLLLSLALGPSGCKDEASGPPAAATAAAEITPSGPIDRLEAPASVLLFGGSEDLAGLARQLKGMLGPAAASIDLEGMGPALGRHLGIPDPSVLVLDAPVRFALVDPRSHEQPLALLIRVASREALLEALPGATKEAGHDTWSYPGLTKNPVYLGFLDDFAVFTSEKGQLEELRPFLRALAGADLGGKATLVVSVRHARALYGKDFEAGLSRARESLARGAADLPPGAGLSGMLDWVGSVSKELDQLVLRVAAREDAIELALEVRPLGGSGMAESLRALGARKLGLLTSLPADAAFALAWSIDPDRPSELTQSLTAWSLQLSYGARFGDEEVAAMDAYWKATRGEMAFAIHPTPGLEGLRVSGLVGIRDGEAARNAQATLRSMYRHPAVAKLFAQVGVEIRYEPRAYQTSGVSVDRISAKLSPAAQAATAHDLRALGRTASIFTDLLNSHVAIGDELGVIAYGEGGAPVIDAWLAGKMPGGLDRAPGLVRAQGRAAPGTFLLAYAQPLTLLRAWEVIPTSGKPAPAEGMALSAGATDGVLHLVLDLPAAQLTPLLSALASLDRRGSSAQH